MTKKLSTLFILSVFFQLTCISYSNAQVGKWHAMKNLPLHPNNGICLLMTDGTVICKNNNGPGNGTGWDRLTPDVHGSYINGTWDTIASMYNDRLFFSSQILPSGKVYVAGGEYGVGTDSGEVYNPVTNSWARCGPIPGGWDIYDGNSEILYDGTVLEGPQIGSATSYNILIWDPVTLNYTVEPNSIYNHDEAEWVKLRDSSVLFVGIASQNANRYIPQTATWVTDASTPGDLYDPYGEEAGCGLMLPNGKTIFFGATPYNCVYTPTGNSSPGTWTSVDSFPKIQGTYMGQPDASGAMMVNGHILLACSPIGSSPSSEFNSPCYFVEYDYLSNTFTQIMDTIPGQGGDSISYIACYQTQMLDLPDGNVLVSVSQTDTVGNQYYIYSPGSGPIPQGKPTINNIIPQGCSFYKITGKLFNGISEGAAYGDDWQCSTNWPIVRVTDGTNVYYAKSTNWNRIGAVCTDSLEDTAYFAIPSIPSGTYSVVVVVNGFASNPVLLPIYGASTSSLNNISCIGANNGSATIMVNNGVGPYTYAWTPNGVTNASASNLSMGTYTISVTDHSGCTTSTTVTITQPTAISAVTDSVSVTSTGTCNGQASITVSGGTAPYTYLWNPSGATTATITGQCPGIYCCTVTDKNGCTYNKCVDIISTVGIENILSSSGDVSIYPNPGNGQFTLQISSYKSGSESIEIYNVLGQEVYSQLNIQHAVSTIDLTSQPDGIYLYRIIQKDGSPIGEGKLIIER